MPRDYLLTIVQLIGVVQCAFIALALLYLPGSHRLASRWLSVLFFVWMLMFAFMAWRQNDLEYLAPVFSFLRLPLFFLCGPLLYLYLRQITEPWRTVDARSAAPHFAIFGLVLLAYLPSLALSHEALLDTLFGREPGTGAPRSAGVAAAQAWLLAISGGVLQAFVLHLLAYLVSCLRVLMRHKRRVLDFFSRLDKVSLDWMRNLLIALVLLWVSAAFSQFLFANTGIGRTINDLQMPALVLFFSALGLFGLLQKSIPLPQPVRVKVDLEGVAEVPNGKAPGTLLTEDQLREGLGKLEALMADAKPYRESELTLTDLAQRLEMPPRRLSQIINGARGQNFIDFVNGYRVEDAKRLLADQSCTSSVLTIAMDVGFNSKSAFYSAFKRYTGQTPSQFRSDCLAAAMPAPQP